MTSATAYGLDDRVLGRRWTVRLDPAGRGSAAVRLSCSRPACGAQRLETVAAGRAAAVAHLKAHLRAASGPRAEAYCACKAEDCGPHLRPTDRGERVAPWRCGGPVVLAVVTDQGGRWWRVTECCSRCAAATPGAKVVATAEAAPAATGTAVTGTASDGAAAVGTAGVGIASDGAASGGAARADDRSSTGTVGAVNTPQFSHASDAGPAAPAAPAAPVSRPATGPRGVPTPRSVPARRRPRSGKIAQRLVPHDLQPVVLRDELIELGNLFRTYQQRAEPDLAVLADLHDRKARAFTTWADVTGDADLRAEAERAEQAAATARLQHRHRTGEGADDGLPTVARLLTGAVQWEHARTVLAHVAEHAPLPGPEARLLTLVLTLRTAHTGTGNLVGQDIAALGLSDPESLIEQLTGCGWLVLPGTVGELLASRPENATPVTVPSLTPDPDGAGPFTFGRKMRPKLSGWAQRVISDKKLRKSKATAATRLIALTLATQTTADGHIGPGGQGGQGVDLEFLASRCVTAPDELQHLVDRLSAADWLAEAALGDTHLTGRLTDRVLPLSCPLP